MRLGAIVLLVAGSSHAIAGGLVIGAGSPRAIGRAGTGTVGDDGAGALLVNPAAIARREGIRGQLGLAFVDDEISFLARGDAPIARNQSASDFAPTGAAFASVGPWVLGLGAMTASVTSRAMRPVDLPPNLLGNLFEYRYAGITGAFQRDTVVAGVSRRIGDNLAIGLSLSTSRVTISESRRVWAGFSGSATVGDPELDVEVRLDGVDWFAPGVTAGVLYAPSDVPFELGASIGWLQTVELSDGEAAAFAATSGRAPRIVTSGATSSFRLRQPLAARAGARYIGERFAAEVGGDLWIAPRSAAQNTWKVSGIRVTDRSGVAADLSRVPSRISLRTHGAFRAAVDAELIGGFLWATAGYAYQVAGTAEVRQSPSFGDLGGHTLALGLEGTAGGFTVTLGWARTWARAQRGETALGLDNPFGAGDAAVPLGIYDGSVDQIGVLVDAEWDID